MKIKKLTFKFVGILSLSVLCNTFSAHAILRVIEGPVKRTGSVPGSDKTWISLQVFQNERMVSIFSGAKTPILIAGHRAGKILNDQDYNPIGTISDHEVNFSQTLGLPVGYNAPPLQCTQSYSIQFVQDSVKYAYSRNCSDGERTQLEGDLSVKSIGPMTGDSINLFRGFIEHKGANHSVNEKVLAIYRHGQDVALWIPYAEGVHGGFTLLKEKNNTLMLPKTNETVGQLISAETFDLSLKYPDLGFIDYSFAEIQGSNLIHLEMKLHGSWYSQRVWGDLASYSCKLC